jgi:hypothetical protein
LERLDPAQRLRRLKRPALAKSRRPRVRGSRGWRSRLRLR